MSEFDRELIEILETYGGNRKQALREKPGLEYLYALSDLRENLMDWYPFCPEGRLLQVGSDYGALTGVYSRKTAMVDVLDVSEENLKVNWLRHVQAEGRENINYYTGSIEAYQDSMCRDGYDYIVFAGSLGENSREQIQAAKRLLKPEGQLLVAVCNPFGMKYWAGAKKDSFSFSKNQTEKLLTEGEPGGSLKFYYPMPDYKLPVTIFSDRYLPAKGDLTDTITAYDYPKYLLMDVGASYDAVCEDGQFDQYANSFFAVWTREKKEEKEPWEIQYVKYNRTRRECFQIKTVIRGDGRKRQVEKSALDMEGTPHIWSLGTSYTSLSMEHTAIKFVKPSMSEDRCRAQFPYVVGKTWAQKLGEEIQEGKAPVRTIQKAMDQALEVKDTARVRFQVTPEFLEVFGASGEKISPGSEDGQPFWKGFEGQECLEISNIDALFENILLTEDGMYCLDYEWVFPFPIPVRFIQYRILFYFYRQYHSILTACPGVEDWLLKFDFTRKEQQIFKAMEESFQQYVHGENQQIFLENYLVKTKNARDLAKVDGELERTKERLEQIKLQLKEKDAAIRKMTEVQRLTNNHVTNLEIMIKDLRHEVEEEGKTLSYLNRHEALIYKARRKLGEQFNRRYPKGSVQRKKLSYMKEYVFHPIRSLQLYTSEEGKNLKDGDFAIGSQYKEHGKVRFPYVEQPVVSIIIPVYNQIHYTYACLLSVLEHTKDVPYEVIIADDMSTDATEHLGRYVEGVTICRGSTNQGFLKNCNHGAQSARGRYLMFLNNDTQVTAGWLSSLVNLIQSDSTIGMVGSKLVYPDGRLQEAGGIIWSDGSGWNYGRLDNPDKPEYNYVKDVDYISGAAILLSNALWKQLGGFDTRFAPAYCEDSDLAFAVREAGYRVVYQPLSRVIHFEGISNGTDVEGTGLKRYQTVNSEKLREKWQARLAKQCENNGNPDPFRARERSMGKKIILVVDHYVPTYDKDAGSKTTFQYLKMFLKKGYVVKFLGDNFLCEEPYSTVLQQMGIEILYGQDYQVGIWDWLKDHGDDIAVAYLNRPHIASKYIDFIKENTNIKVIYYGHDLHFLREGREYALTGDLERRQASEYWKSVEMSLMYKAAVSYYPSYIERDAIKAEDEDIPVKDIVAYVYEEFKENIPHDFAEREGILFVGGFAHPPNADAVIWFVREVYPLIRQKLEAEGIQPPPFYVVGSRVTDEIRALEQPGNGVVIKGFVSEEELAQLYDTTRIVAVPLRYGAGVKGKVVEALYHGAAIVTTSIGAEGIHDAEHVMQIKDRPEEFAQATAQLYQEPQRCLEMSIKTQEYIRRHYSVDAAWRVIQEDFM
ncbi:MAG: glycosyltransferase [Hungatella sp.]|nr:glycosyltransferase [Hungatella sp.]